MNWNRSTLYALSVGILARQIAGGPGVQQAAPDDDQPLSRDTVIDIQTRLARLGLYKDDTDGLLGPKTRSALRLFQQQTRRCRPTAIPRPRRCASCRRCGRQSSGTRSVSQNRARCAAACAATRRLPCRFKGLARPRGTTPMASANGSESRSCAASRPHQLTHSPAYVVLQVIAPPADGNKKPARRSRRAELTNHVSMAGI